MGTGTQPEPDPAEVPAWELEVKPEFDGPMRAFLCPADDEEPPAAFVAKLREQLTELDSAATLRMRHWELTDAHAEAAANDIVRRRAPLAAAVHLGAALAHEYGIVPLEPLPIIETWANLLADEQAREDRGEFALDVVRALIAAQDHRIVPVNGARDTPAAGWPANASVPARKCAATSFRTTSSTAPSTNRRLARLIGPPIPGSQLVSVLLHKRHSRSTVRQTETRSETRLDPVRPGETRSETRRPGETGPGLSISALQPSFFVIMTRNPPQRGGLSACQARRRPRFPRISPRCSPSRTPPSMTDPA